MSRQLKKWQGWLLFLGAMVIVFVLGLLCSSLLERRAEVVSVFNNRRTPMTDSIVAQNEKFAEDFPHEYETWAMTEDTSFVSKYNSSQEQDALAQHPLRSFYGTAMLSAATTTRRAGTVTASKTCARSCARVHRGWTDRRTCNRVRAGRARDLTCHD